MRSLRPTIIPLRRNLRNSFEIVRYVQDATGADVGITGGGHGPDVSLRLVDSPTMFGEEARRVIGELIREGLHAEEIVVITWAEPTAVADALSAYGAVAPAARMDYWPRPNTVRVFNPEQFQGLESPCIVAGPIPDRLDDKELARLYVATTRARGSLWLIGTLAAATQLAKAGEARK